MGSLKRIQKEWNQLLTDPPPFCEARPSAHPEDQFHKEAAIIGPPDTPYAGGEFLVSIQYPSDYPHSPPKVVFRTKVFHPNISSDGTISVDILTRKDWKPSLILSKILLSICSLLTDANPDDPLVPEIAHMYKTDRAKYDATAQNCTEQYAKVSVGGSSITL